VWNPAPGNHVGTNLTTKESNNQLDAAALRGRKIVTDGEETYQRGMIPEFQQIRSHGLLSRMSRLAEISMSFAMQRITYGVLSVHRHPATEPRART
jgi:hypothetical protein